MQPENNDNRKKSLNKHINTGLSRQAESTVLGATVALILFLLNGVWLYRAGNSDAPDAGLAGVFGAFFLFVAFFILLYIIWVIDKDRHRKK